MGTETRGPDGLREVAGRLRNWLPFPLLNQAEIVSDHAREWERERAEAEALREKLVAAEAEIERLKDGLESSQIDADVGWNLR